MSICEHMVNIVEVIDHEYNPNLHVKIYHSYYLKSKQTVQNTCRKYAKNTNYWVRYMK